MFERTYCKPLSQYVSQLVSYRNVRSELLSFSSLMKWQSTSSCLDCIELDCELCWWLIVITVKSHWPLPPDPKVSESDCYGRSSHIRSTMEQITNVFRGLIQSWGVKSTLILSASRHLIFWVDFKIIFVNFLETMCATSTLVLLLNFSIPAFEFFYILVFDFLTFNLAY